MLGAAPNGDSSSSADVTVSHKVPKGEDKESHAHKRVVGRQQLGSDWLIDDVKVLLGRGRNSILSKRIRMCAKRRHVHCFQTVAGGAGRSPD